MEKLVFLIFSLFIIFLLSLKFFADSYYSVEDEDFVMGFASMTNKEKTFFIITILDFSLLVVIGAWWQPKQTYEDYDMTIYDCDDSM